MKKLNAYISLINKNPNLTWFLLFCLSILLGVLFLKYAFWWNVESLEIYQQWYPNFGLYLWLIKIGIRVLVVIAIILLLYKLRSNYSYALFFLYFPLALVFDGNHPFSMVKMYSRLTDEINVFYIDNCKNKRIAINSLSSANGAIISHYYYNMQQDEHINDAEIGALIWAELNIAQSDSCLCLQKEAIAGKEIFKGKKELLYESCP